MAAWKFRKFRELDELNLFLSGAIFGSDVSLFGNAIKGEGSNLAPSLAGKTLIFSNPSGTVTFVNGTDPAGRLLPLEIKTQVETAIATLKVKFFKGALCFIEATPSTGVVMSHTSTAASLLGFDTQADTAGKVYSSPYGTPTAPYVGFGYSTNDNMHIVATWE